MIEVLDLFAGAGGLAEGFRRVTGDDGEPAYRTVGGIDLWEAACKTFEANHGAPAVRDEVGEAAIRSLLGPKGRVDVVVGGPPCQGFSTSGKRALDDPRNQLILRFLQAVELAEPSAFLMENVEGFTTYQGGQLFEETIDYLARRMSGYTLSAGILLASLYGAPQRRRRFILVGVREGKFRFPEPTVPIGSERSAGGVQLQLSMDGPVNPGPLEVDQVPDGHAEITFAEATSDLPPVAAGTFATRYASPPTNAFQRACRNGSKALTEHIAPRHSQKILQMMKHIPEGRSALDPRILANIPEAVRPSSGFPNSYARIWWDRPAPTITRNFTTPSSANCIHPRQDRALTLREGARCQSFQDNYRFVGSFGDKRLLIGNAVPPVLAEALARALLPHLSAS